MQYIHFFIIGKLANAIFSGNDFYIEEEQAHNTLPSIIYYKSNHKLTNGQNVKMNL